MDKCREQFEEWAKSIPLANLKRHLDGYENQTINSHWSTWQASRQALVVEFTTDTYFSPCKTEKELASDEGFDSAIKYVKAALDLAGIKYK